MSRAPTPVRAIALATALLLLAALGRCLTGCAWLKTPQGQAVEAEATKGLCALVDVLFKGEGVGTLCGDIAPAVEAELQKLAAAPAVLPLLGHRERHHRRRVRLVEHAPGRDPGETVEEGAPLEATLEVLRRRGLQDGGAR